MIILRLPPPANWGTGPILPTDYYRVTSLQDDSGTVITTLMPWCWKLANQFNAEFHHRTATLHFKTEEDLVMFKLSTPYPNSNEQK